MKKHIPNSITMMNLFSGCIAIVMAFQQNFLGVFIFVVLAGMFDFFDGFSARLLHVSSPMGVELDSLADVVSFGVAPAAAIFIFLKDFTAYPEFLLTLQEWIPYAAFFIPVFSALRLAKFNIDDRQTTSFLGLPTPADALFWVSFCYGLQNVAQENESLIYVVIAFIALFSWLMVCEIPMFSFKIKSKKLKGNEKQLLLVVLMIAFVSLWGILGIAAGILGYIAISIFMNKKEATHV